MTPPVDIEEIACARFRASADKLFRYRHQRIFARICSPRTLIESDNEYVNALEDLGHVYKFISQFSGIADLRVLEPPQRGVVP